jgi:3-deoxy-D-manno-octulosonic-acid transferase
MNERISFNPMERTRYKDLKPEDSINKRVLYIDFVGGLKSIYQYTNYALIGGGFIPKGIHNIIEPAIYGNPVTFGPNHRDYVEALEMIGNGYAVIHHNKEELDALIEKAFYNKHKEVVSDKIKAYVQSKIGADDKILKDLSLLEDLRK